MILELLSSKYDQMVGYYEQIESDKVDEYIYKHYSLLDQDQEDEEQSKNDEGTFDTLMKPEDQMIQWKKDKRKVQLLKRRAYLLKLQEQIIDDVNDVNDFDKIGDQQIIDHAPDYETTQNEALSMECGAPNQSQKQDHNPLDDGTNEENSFKINENKIQSVNDHCNQFSLEQDDQYKRNIPQISTNQPTEGQNVEIQTPYEKSKGGMSVFTPGQISPTGNGKFNKSLKSGVHGREFSMTDDKSFQVSENDDRNIILQNTNDQQMFLGLPQQTLQKNNKIERQITSEDPNSVISEETSNKEQTPSGFNSRKNRKMKDMPHQLMNEFYQPDKGQIANEYQLKGQTNNSKKQKARRTDTTIKPLASQKYSPFKKQSTQKYKTQQDSVSGMGSSKFVVNLINKKHDGQPFTTRGSNKRDNENYLKTALNMHKIDRSKDDKHDLNSSLNLTMDNKMEDLSVNFNQQYLYNEINQDEARKQRTHSYKSQNIKSKVKGSYVQKQPIIAQSRNNQFSP